MCVNVLQGKKRKPGWREFRHYQQLSTKDAKLSRILDNDRQRTVLYPLLNKLTLRVGSFKRYSHCPQSVDNYRT